jgi:hypothetical protein
MARAAVAMVVEDCYEIVFLFILHEITEYASEAKMINVPHHHCHVTFQPYTPWTSHDMHFRSLDVALFQPGTLGDAACWTSADAVADPSASKWRSTGHHAAARQ